jgi:uncharacterized protein (DUF2147 family)
MIGTKFLAALPGVLVIVGFEYVCSASELADPTGLWLAKDGARVSITSCGDELCGVMASTPAANDPATGAPWTDKNNRDPTLRGRPLAGVPVLIGMQPKGNGKWSGHLYNTDDGKTYSGNLIEIDANTIRIEGCLLFLCGGDNLTRIQ